MPVSLRGGGGELGNLKTLTYGSLLFLKGKLEHTIYMCNYGCSNVKLPSQKKVCNLQPILALYYSRNVETSKDCNRVNAET
jgi:hypothetical protein